jgi:hypothetical protein
MPSVMRASVNGEDMGTVGTGGGMGVTTRLSNPIAPNVVAGMTVMLVTGVAGV